MHLNISIQLGLQIESMKNGQKLNELSTLYLIMNEKTVDKYKLLTTDLLGAGSFAKVYKGIDTTNNRLVAIKMLPK